MACDAETEGSVCPSGVASATMRVPTVPPAPGRLSTITCWPRVSVSFIAIARAVMSGCPPGVKPTTMRIGRFGKLDTASDFCAAAAEDTQPHATITAAPLKARNNILRLLPDERFRRRTYEVCARL